ncbi:AraC family transcriptional regulator [Teredinibacter haidensis]|uniref:AraC family transcriptional regulator n=1 Tax=Teredinibacter haidensis TaxID=2731755 RepID=UPI0009F82452|nr:AraC family transcriptional regulator [Teredinibacter haidensis]
MNTLTPMVPSEYAIRLLEQAEASGCDKNEILEIAQCTWSDLTQNDEITGRCYSLLYQAVMRVTENEWFGMFVGEKVPLGSFRMMCLTLLSCMNLQQVVIRAGEFAEICRGMKTRIRLERINNEAIVYMAPVHSSSQGEFDSLINNADPSSILTSIIVWHKFAEWLTGKSIRLNSIQLSFSQEHVEKPLAYVHGANIVHNCSRNGFAFSVECLEYPLVQDSDSVMAFLSTAPYHLVTEDPSMLNFAQRVRNILKRDVSRAIPSAEHLASQLNMSVTTLRRQLAKEGASYQKLKDDCRMEAAIYYLSCQELSSSDIADKLGFDEPSAFFRSFKKWTGQTPGAYRARLDQNSTRKLVSH